MSNHPRLKLISTLILTALMSACAQTQVNIQSSVQLPKHFEHTPSAITHENIQHWWTQWQDKQLNQLIETALQNNLDIALAQARLAEIHANHQFTQANKGPQIGAQAVVNGIATRADLPFVGTQHSEASMMGVGLVASWEPDFFGKKKSDADAARYAALSQQEQVYATQLAIVSHLAKLYFQFNTLHSQSAILSRHIQTLKRLEQYLKGRFNAGHITRYELDDVAAKVLQLKAQQQTLQAQADTLQRQMSLLSGQTPQQLKLKVNTAILNQAPKAPSGSLPSELLERRPDIRAYSLAMQARAAQLASAKADLYPRFDIQFLGQGGRLSFNSDFSGISGGGGLLSVGVQLPIFTNGRIQANIDAADARLKQSIIDYDKALLTALAEVETSYQMHTALSQKLNLQSKQINQQKQLVSSATTLFQHGSKTLDQVISAQLEVLNIESQQRQTQLQRHENLVELYKSLGGGW